MSEFRTLQDKKSEGLCVKIATLYMHHTIHTVHAVNFVIFLITGHIVIEMRASQEQRQTKIHPSELNFNACSTQNDTNIP